MQGEAADRAGRHPRHLVGLVVVRADGERLLGLGQHGGVGPAAVVVGEHGPLPDRAGWYATLLVRLTQRRRQRGFVTVAGSAGQAPGAAVMAPPGPPLEQDRPVSDVGEQPGRAEPAPVAVPELA